MKNKNYNNLKRFTYGAQFDPNQSEIDKYISLSLENEPSREKLEKNLRNSFFSTHSNKTSEDIKDDNQRKLAMNTFLSLKEYKLIAKDKKDKTKYYVTDIAKRILNLNKNKNKMYDEFAYHILTNLSGTDLLRSIETINERNEDPTLQKIISELNEMGYEMSKNVVYPSTMRQWLQKAGVFEGKYSINWEKFYKITNVSKDIFLDTYSLNSQQKYFLLALINLGATNYIEWPKVLKHISSLNKIDYDMKMFPKLVIKPLIDLHLIEEEKTTAGRGAKPNKVKLTFKSESEFLKPFLENIANLSSIEPTELNKELNQVLLEIENENTHIKGKALELLAIWMIRLCGLRFTAWRKRDHETGKGEVDVLAASDTFTYSRWQIQCKNTKKVSVDVLAKEVGMTFQTNADIIMVVTTGFFSSDAIKFADRMNSHSRYYIILINQNDLNEIKNDLSQISTLLNKKAHITYMKKEYKLTNEQINHLNNYD